VRRVRCPLVLGISAGHLMAFAVTAFVIIVIPGPSVLFVVSRALASGRRVALLSVVGNTCGEYAQVVAVAFGLGAIAERSIVAFTVLKLLGGAYLIYLGVRTFRERGGISAAFAAPRPDRRSFLQGLVVGASNPKTIVFMAAILPQFVTLSSGRIPEQILFLGAVFAVLAIASDSAWALAAGTFRDWFASSPRRLRLIGGAGWLAIAALGAGLLLAPFSGGSAAGGSSPAP
jgi:threonine/homoserine/homoserine lactone efflux protein